MQINIKKSNDIQQYKQQQIKKQSGNYKQIKMTLKQYLQSINLKRKIKSRSQSKQNTIKSNENNQKNLLQPGFMDKTIEYYKLNQQWKAKNTFNSWIVNVKQLCREYIQNDSHFIQIIRIIDKMTQFVKNQIESFKKDNLLLQSYLVTQASYWPVKSGYNGNNQNVDNKDFDKYFQHIPIGKSQFYKSTQKKFQQSHEKVQNPRVIQNPQRQNRSSTQPKALSNNNENSKNSKTIFQSNNYRSSSTCVKNDPNSTSIQSKENNLKGQKMHHIYSFQDKNSQSQKNSNHNNQSDVKQFHHQQNEYQQFIQKHKYLNIQTIGLKSIQQQMPRISLMSKYEQDISQQSTKSQIQDNVQISQIHNKIPLRDRKYNQSKYQYNKISQPIQQNFNEFDQIFIRVDSPQKQYKQIISHKNRHSTINKAKISEQQINNSKYLQKQQQLKQYSPLILGNRTNKNYDQTISLQTPTTFKRLNYQNEDKNSNANIYKNIHKKQQNDEKVGEIKSSREDIMKRYDTFRNLQ